MTKRILHSLVLEKIAAVDFPCQEPAQALIIKRAADSYDKLLKGKYSAEDRRAMAGKEAMEDGSYPIKDADDLDKAIRAVGRGRNNSHAAIRRHVMARAKALGLSDHIPDTWNDGGKIAKAICDAITKAGIGLNDPDGDEGAQDFNTVLGEQQLTQAFWDNWYKATNALQESLVSIIKDDEVADKGPLITQSLKEFADHVETILPGEIGKALAAGIAAKFAGGAGARPENGGNSMPNAIAKALGLPDTATEAEILKAVADKEKKLEEAEKECKVAKMSDKHKNFMDHPKAKLPSGGKEAFAGMSASERDDHMEKHPLPSENDDVEKALASGDAFKTPEGAVVMKSKVGAEVFAILKSQNARLIAQGEELAKAKEDAIVKKFEDLAEDNGFAKSFAPTLRKALGSDETAVTALLKEIGAVRAQAEEAGIFKEFGGRGSANAGTAEAEIMAKVSEVQKADPKLSKEQAFARVYKSKDNAALVARYKAEQANARA